MLDKKPWQAEIGDLAAQFAAFKWRLDNNIWLFSGSFLLMHKAMPIAEKFLADKKLTYREMIVLIEAFDQTGQIGWQYGEDFKVRFSVERFYSAKEEIKRLLLYWINEWTMKHN